jgi:glutamate dehydrogenase (NADP+)
MTQLALEKQIHRSLMDVRCAISGSGNVAQYAAQKLIQLGAKVVAMSDSNGVLVFDNGMTIDNLEVVMECKNKRRGRLSSIADCVEGRFIPGKSPWSLLSDLTYDIALPCATQNEILAEHARHMVSNGVIGVLEGANLPTNLEAQEILRQAGILYIPGKASNAGGVGVSGFEMSQNAQRLIWSSHDVDEKLQDMMSNIYEQMADQQRKSMSDETNVCCTLEQGANRAGFLKVANAMKDLGWLF